MWTADRWHGDHPARPDAIEVSASNLHIAGSPLDARPPALKCGDTLRCKGAPRLFALLDVQRAALEDSVPLLVAGEDAVGLRADALADCARSHYALSGVTSALVWPISSKRFCSARLCAFPGNDHVMIDVKSSLSDTFALQPGGRPWSMEALELGDQKRGPRSSARGWISYLHYFSIKRQHTLQRLGLVEALTDRPREFES